MATLCPAHFPVQLALFLFPSFSLSLSLSLSFSPSLPLPVCMSAAARPLFAHVAAASCVVRSPVRAVRKVGGACLASLLSPTLSPLSHFSNCLVATQSDRKRSHSRCGSPIAKSLLNFYLNPSLRPRPLSSLQWSRVSTSQTWPQIQA